MKLKHFLTLASLVIGGGSLWAQESVPFLSEKNDFGGTAVSSLSTFRPSGTTYTLELTGCTEGTVITVPGGSFSYTPTASGTVRFVRIGETVHVYEGTTYKGTVEVSNPADPTYPNIYGDSDNSENKTGIYSTDNLFKNPGFEEKGDKLANNQFKAVNWDANGYTYSNRSRVRDNANLSGQEGSCTFLIHGYGNPADYLSQKLEGLNNFTPYQVKLKIWFHEGAACTYSATVGTSIGDGTLYKGDLATPESGSADRTFIFTTDALSGENYYFTLTRKTSSRLGNFDRMTMVAANGGGIGITGATGATFLSGSAFAPEGVLAAAVEDGPVDATSWVKNPNFESNINDWNTPIGGGKLADNKQDQTRNFYESWNSSPKDGRMYQVIENLPSGTYELEMIAFADQAGTMNAANTTVAVYAQGQEVGTTSSPYIRPNYVNSVNFTPYKAYAYVDNTGKLEIGMRQYQPAKFRWLGMDNVTLKYVATNNQEEAKMLTLYQEKWNAVKTALSAVLDNDAYINVTGDERTALSEAIANGVEVSVLADYKSKADAAETAYLAFIAAKTNYDLYVAEKANAERIDASITSGVSVPTTAAGAEAAMKTILVNEYNYVKDNFNADAAATYGITIDQWTGTATSGDSADTPQTNSNEKWGTTATTYYEQGKNGWGSNAWTLNYTKTVTLPANTYVLKVAARASAGTTATLKATIGETTITETLPNVGSNGKGITTAGVASFDEGEFARNGEGYGWQWRYLAFTLESEGEVTLQIDASANSKEQWCSFGDVAVVSNVTTDDMETAYNKFEMKTLGFQKDEYAPYNNVAVLEAYAQAKAIVDGTAVPSTQVEVDAITTTLTSPTWTANAADVDAIYNGDFSTGSWSNNTWYPTGWKIVSGWSSTVDDAQSSSGKGVYRQPGDTHYGDQGVFSMPLVGNQLYKLTFKYGYRDQNVTPKISIMNESNEGLATKACATAYSESSYTTSIITQTMYFKTGEAGNYVLNMNTDKNIVFSDVSLVKAEAAETTLSFGTVANNTFYQTLTLDRTFSAEKWNTLCVPFEFDKSKFAAVKVLSSVAEVAGDVNMTFADADDTVAAGTPCLVKAKNNGEGLTVTNVALDPAATAGSTVVKTADEKTTVTYQGTYAGTTLTADANGNAWVVSNNNLYNVDSDVTVGAYRAYFTVETAGAVKALNFNFDAVDAIEAIDNGQLATGNVEIFNLAGQRVNKAQRGIYIVNGKKVLVK